MAIMTKIATITIRKTMNYFFVLLTLISLGLFFSDESQGKSAVLSNNYHFNNKTYRIDIKKIKATPCNNNDCNYDVLINEQKIGIINASPESLITINEDTDRIHVYIQSSSKIINYVYLVIEPTRSVNSCIPFEFPEVQRQRNLNIKRSSLFIANLSVGCVSMQSELYK